MKIKRTLKNLAILPVVIILNLPIAIIISIMGFIGSISDWIEDNLFHLLPKLDIDYSEYNEQYEKETINKLFKLTQRKPND